MAVLKLASPIGTLAISGFVSVLMTCMYARWLADVVGPVDNDGMLFPSTVD
jgi:hypothetical protein